MVQPFDFAANGRAIVSSIGADPDDEPILNWQCCGSGEFEATSEIVDADDAVTLPDDLTITEGETIIAAEVFYAFEPLFGVGLQPRTIRRVGFFKPRLGELSEMTCPA